jgi:hypothetical protein
VPISAPLTGAAEEADTANNPMPADVARARVKAFIEILHTIETTPSSLLRAQSE